MNDRPNDPPPGPAPPPPGDWSLEPATPAERPLLAQLLQLYLYDFSDVEPDNVDEDGRFAYRWLDDYGQQPGYHALLLRVRGKPAGFVLLEELGFEENPEAHDIAEFFVMRAFRRAGYGTAMARALFERFPGPWQIESIGENVPAQRFWRRVVAGYTAGRYQERTTDRGHVIQEFDTQARGTG